MEVAVAVVAAVLFVGWSLSGDEPGDRRWWRFLGHGLHAVVGLLRLLAHLARGAAFHILEILLAGLFLLVLRELFGR